MIRATRTLQPAGPGRGATSLGPFLGRSFHAILTESLRELGQLARDSKLPEKGYSSRDWDFNLGVERAVDYCFTGDTAAVEESDKLLSQMEEHMQMPSTRTLWTDDVTGAFPNIPAYLAGVPLNMRQRVRVQIDSAPLCIMVDLGISAAISAAQVRNRGIAILALTRALSAHRPIELWAGDFGDSRGTDAVFIAAKIETSPLNLAEASYALTHPAFVRNVLFGLETKHHDFTGGWPFRLNRALTRLEMEVLLAPLFSHVTETLCLPGLHVADESMTNPLQWLKRQLAEHDPLKLEEV